MEPRRISGRLFAGLLLTLACVSGVASDTAVPYQQESSFYSSMVQVFCGAVGGIMPTVCGTPGVAQAPVNPCSPNPCLNGGLCFIIKENIGHCSCPTGFAGERCENVVAPPMGSMSDRPMSPLIQQMLEGAPN